MVRIALDRRGATPIRRDQEPAANAAIGAGGANRWRDVGHSHSSTTGLLPPPLWGRGGERGGSEFGICDDPSPCPSPTRGEGTLWHCSSQRQRCVCVRACSLGGRRVGILNTRPADSARFS